MQKIFATGILKTKERYGAMKNNSCVSQNGFSIIEVMIGIAIFSIGVIAVAGMQVSGIRGNASARQYTEISTWGMDTIENLMTLPYDHNDLVNRDEEDDDPDDLGLFDATEATADWFVNDPDGKYTIYWNVAENDLVENSKTVSVIILWNNTATRRSVSMQRVIPEII